MLKVLRLAINNRRNFSLFQLNKLFKQAASQHRILAHSQNTSSSSSNSNHNTNNSCSRCESSEPVNNSKMSATETNGSTSSSPQTTAPTQNLDGMVKFLELLGKLKVSAMWSLCSVWFSFKKSCVATTQNYSNDDEKLCVVLKWATRFVRITSVRWFYKCENDWFWIDVGCFLWLVSVCVYCVHWHFTLYLLCVAYFYSRATERLTERCGPISRPRTHIHNARFFFGVCTFRARGHFDC